MHLISEKSSGWISYLQLGSDLKKNWITDLGVDVAEMKVSVLSGRKFRAFQLGMRSLVGCLGGGYPCRISRAEFQWKERGAARGSPMMAQDPLFCKTNNQLTPATAV